MVIELSSWGQQVRGDGWVVWVGWGMSEEKPHGRRKRMLGGGWAKRNFLEWRGGCFMCFAPCNSPACGHRIEQLGTAGQGRWVGGLGWGRGAGGGRSEEKPLWMRGRMLFVSLSLCWCSMWGFCWVKTDWGKLGRRRVENWLWRGGGCLCSLSTVPLQHVTIGVGIWSLGSSWEDDRRNIKERRGGCCMYLSLNTLR